MTSQYLQIKNAEPHFVLHEGPDTLAHTPNYVRVEIINVLLSSTELNILNQTKTVSEGLILGGVGIGRVKDISSARNQSQNKNITVDTVVVIGSQSPCQVCAACERERWDECKDPQTLGLHTNGVARSEVWLHVHNLTAVEVEPDVESVRQFLLHEIVSNGVWLATQDLITRDSVVGIIGRPFVTQILKNVIEDLSSVEIVPIQQGVFAGFGRFDVVIDCDGETLPPEEVAKLIRPGGVLIHSYTPARASALERATTASPLRQVELRNGPSFLAVEWIAQNPHYFKDLGAAFAFSPMGLSALLKNEGLRETHGFLYFEMRPEWIELSNSDQGVVLNNPVSEVA